MKQLRTPEQEYAEDIFFGQVVIIWSRWFLILCGMILGLWLSDTVNELMAVVIPVAALMAMNFFFHGRYILERPANHVLVLISAVLDLLIVTAVVTFIWPGRQGALSSFFVVYYPVVSAVSFVFPPRYSLIYVSVALLLYLGSCFAIYWNYILDSVLLEHIVMVLVTIAATGALGMYYWRIQRDRRRQLTVEDYSQQAG